MPELETSKLLTVLSEMPKELLEGFAGGYTVDSGNDNTSSSSRIIEVAIYREHNSAGII